MERSKRFRTPEPVDVTGVSWRSGHRLGAALVMAVTWLLLSWRSLVGVILGMPWPGPQEPNPMLLGSWPANALAFLVILFVAHLGYWHLIRRRRDYLSRLLVAFTFAACAALTTVLIMELRDAWLLNQDLPPAVERDGTRFVVLRAVLHTFVGIIASPHVFLLGSLISAAVGLRWVLPRDERRAATGASRDDVSPA